MKYTLRQLQVFDAVMRYGSVTKAANMLNISQSAASSALVDLQDALQRQLFIHARGRALEVTGEGKRLRPIVHALLMKMQDLEPEDAGSVPSGLLVIGATALIAETVLPRLCIEFMALHPAVNVQLETEPTRTLLTRLERGELETALIELLPKIASIELVHWRTDELLLVVGADHPLAGRRGLSIRDLKGFAWCTREAHSSTAANLRYKLYDELGTFPVAFEATSNWAVRHAVIAGGGIGCLSRALIQFDLDNGRLVRLDVPAFSYTRPLSLARPSGTGRSKLLAAFDAFLVARGDPQ
jgi:DNA-binding transcriptional LysR family regulator